MTETLTATLTTSQGTISIRLFPDHAPKTVRNFVELAEGGKEWSDPRTRQVTKDKLYDGTIFHRVIPQFMIQGGDPAGNGSGDIGFTIPDEFAPDLKFDQVGRLAMANIGQPHTGASQFFITDALTPWLNGKHTIFGEVISGQDIVDTISHVQTRPGDRPVTDVVLQSVTINRG